MAKLNATLVSILKSILDEHTKRIDELTKRVTLLEKIPGGAEGGEWRLHASHLQSQLDQDAEAIEALMEDVDILIDIVDPPLEPEPPPRPPVSEDSNIIPFPFPLKDTSNVDTDPSYRRFAREYADLANSRGARLDYLARLARQGTPTLLGEEAALGKDGYKISITGSFGDIGQPTPA